MSAYGTITRPATNAIPLTSTFWECETKHAHRVTSGKPGSFPSCLTIHHLTLATARALPGLIEYLNSVFALDIQAGLTYPQEILDSQEAFEAYFFAADVFIGIVGEGAAVIAKHMTEGINEVVMSIEESKGDRSWLDCVAGFYYIKPNYPGRSSHICNAGFVVSLNYRGCGYGTTLGRSYLHYAPKLGYRASVFNLVYVSNTASIRIWQHLGFEKVGLIPKAGRLKCKDGAGEEYVDAWIFYKSFVDE